MNNHRNKYIVYLCRIMQWFQHFIFGSRTLPFLGGWLADRILGDPEGWPHPVIGFGKLIGSVEKALNQGENKAAKGTTPNSSVI